MFRVLLCKRAELPAPGALPLAARFHMDGDSCPGILGVQVVLEVIGKVMRLHHRDIAGDDKVELDEDLRT